VTFLQARRPPPPPLLPRCSNVIEAVSGRVRFSLWSLAEVGNFPFSLTVGLLRGVSLGVGCVFDLLSFLIQVVVLISEAPQPPRLPPNLCKAFPNPPLPTYPSGARFRSPLPPPPWNITLNVVSVCPTATAFSLYRPSMRALLTRSAPDGPAFGPTPPGRCT